MVFKKLVKSPKILLFFILFFAYLSIMSGNFWEADSQAVYETTKSMVERFSLDMPCYFATKSEDGKCYTQYGIFMSLALMPFYAIEKIFRDIFHNQYFFPGFFSSLMNIVFAPALLILVYQYLIKLKFSRSLAILGTFIYGFATYLPAYVKSIYAETLLTLLLYGCLYILFFCRNNAKNLFLSGLLFGLAFLTKVSVIIFIPAIIFVFWKRKIGLEYIRIFLIPAIVCLLIFFGYNFIRFGNVTDTGYQNGRFLSYPFLKGLYFHLLSPGKSIFLYQPIIIFAFLGFKEFYRKQKLLFYTLGLMTVIDIVFYSLYKDPPAGLAWGTRFLFYILPFFIISTVYSCRMVLHSKFLKVLFYFFLIISVLIQTSSIYLSYHRYYAFLAVKNNSFNLEQSYFDPTFSPLIWQWKLIFRMDYKDSEREAWRSGAFQEYIDGKFDINYKIAPPDLFFIRSKKLWPVFILLLALQIYLIRKLKINTRC